MWAAWSRSSRRKKACSDRVGEAAILVLQGVVRPGQAAQGALDLAVGHVQGEQLVAQGVGLGVGRVGGQGQLDHIAQAGEGHPRRRWRRVDGPLPVGLGEGGLVHRSQDVGQGGLGAVKSSANRGSSKS